jgi:hypothetical protein
MDSRMEALVRELADVRTLSSLRPVAARVLRDRPTSACRIAVAAWVGIEICMRVDGLRATRGYSGVSMDTAIYPGCCRVMHDDAVERGPWMREMVDAAASVVAELAGFGMLDSYESMLNGLVTAGAFDTESDDLVAHRCLLALHAVTETHLRVLQGRLGPVRGVDGRGAARYEKGNARTALLETARGPILGHHQLLTLNCPTCSHAAMGAKKAFVSYRENLCWLTDWDTASRGDSGTFAALEIEAGADLADDTWMWRRRNAIGAPFNAWLARLDHAGKQATGGRWLHTGVLCDCVSSAGRKLAMVSILYGSYHFWPVDRALTLDDYAVYVCASIGEMLRGYTIDHDAEAGIDEHSLYNWLCVDCAKRASQDGLSHANARAPREDWEMRIAWGPQSYFYCSLRHQGFRRRVDRLAGRDGQVEVSEIPARGEPIRSGDPLRMIIRRLLARIGVEVGGPVLAAFEVDLDRWRVAPRLCAECGFDGDRAQLYMLAIGCARLAASLPARHRDALVALIDTYGFRLFPALQVRMLVQCSCTAQWLADVMSAGYDDAGRSCGQTACLATDPVWRPVARATAAEDAADGGRSWRERLLAQAFDEARRYARDTGKTGWLGVVSRRLSAVTVKPGETEPYEGRASPP